MVTTSVHAEPATKQVKAGESLTLTATLKNDAGAVIAHDRWRWEKRRAGRIDFEPEGTGGTTFVAETNDPGTWVYRATALGPGDQAVSGAETAGTITVKVTGDGVRTTDEPPKAPLVFRPLFAILTFIVVMGLLVLFAWKSQLLKLDTMVGEKAAELDPRAALAADVIGPILLIAAGLIAFGIWMIIVEWRGAFTAAKANKNTPKGFDLTEALKILKDLKGANLLVIGGIATIFSVAWMVSATVSSPAPDPTPTPTQTTPAAEDPAPVISGEPTAPPTDAPTGTPTGEPSGSSIIGPIVIELGKA